MIWYKDKTDDDIIVSTRVRLARNLSDYKFVNSMTADEMKKAKEKIEKSIINSNSTLSRDFEIFDIDKINDVEKQKLLEKHLISPELLNKNEASVLINNDDNMSIMIMEEDHIRLQVILGGYKLNEAYDIANKVDDVIDENVTYAFHKDFGYLTSCPTNTGTGLRASVMMHLPALTMTDNIQRVASSASNLGIAVRGMYGEGSKAHGAMYQISNQITLGLSEKEIIEKVKNIVNQIAQREKQARQMLMDNNKELIEDKIYRSYGLLKYAKSMSSSEAKELISNVLMGKNMGIIDIGEKNLVELMIMAEPAFIESSANKRLNPEQRDRLRAQIIQKVI